MTTASFTCSTLIVLITFLFIQHLLPCLSCRGLREGFSNLYSHISAVRNDFPCLLHFLHLFHPVPPWCKCNLWGRKPKEDSLTYSQETPPASVTVQRGWLGCSLGCAEFTYEIWIWCSNEFVVGIWDEMLMCGRQSSLSLWVLRPHTVSHKGTLSERKMSLQEEMALREQPLAVQSALLIIGWRVAHLFSFLFVGHVRNPCSFYRKWNCLANLYNQMGFRL